MRHLAINQALYSIVFKGLIRELVDYEMTNKDSEYRKRTDTRCANLLIQQLHYVEGRDELDQKNQVLRRNGLNQLHTL